jgi:hypothetical protein
MVGPFQRYSWRTSNQHHTFATLRCIIMARFGVEPSMNCTSPIIARQPSALHISITKPFRR